MPPSFTSSAFVPVAFGLCFLTACAEPAPYDLRRLSIEKPREELLEAAGVSRPGLRLREEEAGVAVDLASLTAGRISLFLAPSGEAASGGLVDVDLQETGWRSWTGTALHERCSLRWGEPGTPADAPWQPCTFDLPRNMETARLAVTRRGDRDGEVFVSEVRIEGRASRRLPNVFILLLDAVRFDGLRPFRANSGVGDRMEELARDSVVLRNLHSSSSWTRPAVATLFTGLRADRHRVLDRGDMLTGETTTLAEMLRDRGYSGAAWSTNPNVLPVWGLAQGFDAFVDQGSHSWGTGKTDGAVVVSRLRAALASRGPEPVFYYAHLMDPHAPYQPSREQREQALALPDIKSSFPRPLAILNSYNDWLAYVDYTGELLDTDDHVGEFVDALKDAGVYDDSIILVLADHGEEFIDHGGRDHGRTLYEEVLHVPALLKLPGNRLGGRVVQDSVSMVDMLPTLLAALGVDVPAGLDGVPIDLDEEDGEAAPKRPQIASLRLDGRRQSTILDPPWKFIRNDIIGRRELYKLDDDPLERANLVVWHPDVAARLSSTLELMLSHGQEGWHILLCGSLEEDTMDLTVHPSSGTVQPFGFQEGEVTALPDQAGVWRLHPTLTPVTVERPAFGTMTKVLVPEQAELLIGDDGSTEGAILEIRTEPGSPVDYRTGASARPASATRIVLDSRAPDVAYTQAARIECAPASGTSAPAKPFLRVWYVPPVPKVATESLDAAMRERLRALGYLQ